MNIKSAFAALLLVVACPTLSSAATASKVGTVTFALVGTYAPDVVYTTTGTTTSGKNAFVLQKYSNKEIVAALIANTTLTGAVADWSLKYVEDVTDEIFGFFALNKNGSAVYLGGTNDSGFFINIAPGVTVETLVDTYSSTTQKQTYTTTDVGSVTLTLSLSLDATFTARAIYKGAKTFKNDDLNLTYAYSATASSFSSIAGDDSPDGSTAGSTVLTGSIKISALKDTADVSAYLTAYNSVSHGDI